MMKTHKVGAHYGDNEELQEYVHDDETIMTVAIVAVDRFGVPRTYVFNRENYASDLRLELIELTRKEN